MHAGRDDSHLLCAALALDEAWVVVQSALHHVEVMP
jgi:hypothetical protein